MIDKLNSEKMDLEKSEHLYRMLNSKHKKMEIMFDSLKNELVSMENWVEKY